MNTRALSFIVTLVLLGLVACTPSLAEPVAPPPEVEAFMQDFMAATEARDLEKTLALYADSVVWEDPAEAVQYDREVVEDMYRDLFSLPDVMLDTTAYFISSNGDRAAVEWIWSGTRGDETYSIRGASILELQDLKIVRETIYYDPTLSPYR